MPLKNLSLLAVVCAISVCAGASEITDLKFAELLLSPVGDRGIAVSEKAQKLNGSRVRVMGYVAQHDRAPAGMFLLAPVPVQLHDEHYGLADDLPATTIFVSTGARGKQIVGGRDLVTVVGVFRVGNREEADGRISTFRIDADQPTRRVKSKGGFFKFQKRQDASHSKDS
jgi:hypothetical protein